MMQWYLMSNKEWFCFITLWVTSYAPHSFISGRAIGPMSHSYLLFLFLINAITSIVLVHSK